MNDSTVVDCWESGARDGIQEYCQDLHVSASEELTKENENGSREWIMSKLRAAESAVRKMRKKVAIMRPNGFSASRYRKLHKIIVTKK
jgi:hypothetical protein